MALTLIGRDVLVSGDREPCEQGSYTRPHGEVGSIASRGCSSSVKASRGGCDLSAAKVKHALVEGDAGLEDAREEGALPGRAGKGGEQKGRRRCTYKAVAL